MIYLKNPHEKLVIFEEKGTVEIVLAVYKSTFIKKPVKFPFLPFKFSSFI